MYQGYCLSDLCHFFIGSWSYHTSSLEDFLKTWHLVIFRVCVCYVCVLCVYVFTCVCVYMCVHVFMCVYVYVCVYMCVRVYMCVCVYVYVFICVCMSVHTWPGARGTVMLPAASPATGPGQLALAAVQSQD